MSLQSFTLNLSLNININENGQATVSINSDDTTKDTTSTQLAPVVPVLEYATKDEQLTGERKQAKGKKQATVMSDEQIASVQASVEKALADSIHQKYLKRI